MPEREVEIDKLIKLQDEGEIYEEGFNKERVVECNEEVEICGENPMQPIYEAITTYLNVMKAIHDAARRMETEEQRLLREIMEQQQEQARIANEQQQAAGDYVDTMQNMLEHLRNNYDNNGSPIRPKAHPLDQKYPRVCYNCKRKISHVHAFEEYMHKALDTYTLQLDNPKFSNQPDKKTTKLHLNCFRERIKERRNFIKIWRDSRVQFLCCSCFEKRDRILLCSNECNGCNYYNPSGKYNVNCELYGEALDDG